LDEQTAPHDTSLAVWEVPAAVAAGERFAVKVGAKSSAGCALAGHRIEIVDDAGALLGSGALGDAPWPGTTALFWADVELAAPAAPGRARLSARFEPAELAEPHRGAASSFDVAVVAKPEHTLTVAVTCEGLPIEEAHIRLGAYRGVTDADGRTAIRLAKGRYELVVWKAGYDTPDKALEIDADALVSIEATAIPEENPDARWTL
jgi:hypothetical protein